MDPTLGPERTPPRDGLAGLKDNWRSDLVAAVSVSLVALPLALGIAMASDLPPISGLISAFVGGLVTTFIRGSHMAVNGPANGLIVALLAAVVALKDEQGSAYPYVLAAIVIAGVIQTLLGVMRMATVGDFFPPSVIQGMLAAFGVIIVTKQAHVAMGSHATGSMVDAFTTLPEHFFSLNLPIFTLSVLSLAILLLHSRTKNRSIHFLPPPLWVLLFAIPAAHALDLRSTHEVTVGGWSYPVGPHLLVSIPDSLHEALVSPDFSRVGEPVFWMVVLSLCFVTSIETVLSAKAVDKLDPFRRRTDLNRDLAAVGVSTIVSGLLGGLPVSAVIVRSSVNINHGAQTRWSNFFQGLLLLGLVLIAPGLVQDVPLAALAAILIATGSRLAGAKVFRDALRRGNEQFVILVSTLVATLVLGLLPGIAVGLLLTLLLHWVLSNMAPAEYLRSLVRPEIRLVKEEDRGYWLKVRGVANFCNLWALHRQLSSIPTGNRVIVDLVHAKLVDSATQEYLHEQAVASRKQGTSIEHVGLSHHIASTEHPFALRRSRSPLQDSKGERLSARQRRLAVLAHTHGWHYVPGIDWEPLTEQVFHFFESRPIEYRSNVIKGQFTELGIEWEVEDLTFDEGAFLAAEEHHTTVLHLRLPFEVPLFSMERREIIDSFLDLAGYRESDFVVQPDISNTFIVRGLRGANLQSIFSEELLELLHSRPVYHLECNGNALLLFKYDRLAGPGEIEEMLDFSKEMVELLREVVNRTQS